MRQSAQVFKVNVEGSTADGLHTAADNKENLSHTYAWRPSSNTMIYIGATHAKDSTSRRTDEIYLKLQFDAQRAWFQL